MRPNRPRMLLGGGKNSGSRVIMVVNPCEIGNSKLEIGKPVLYFCAVNVRQVFRQLVDIQLVNQLHLSSQFLRHWRIRPRRKFSDFGFPISSFQFHLLKLQEVQYPKYFRCASTFATGQPFQEGPTTARAAGRAINLEKREKREMPEPVARAPPAEQAP